jgi:hypothetical protein
MKKSTWWIFGLTATITLAIAFASYSLNLKICVPVPEQKCDALAWFDRAALVLKPYALLVTLVLSGTAILVQGLERAYGGYKFRRDSVGKFLDQIVSSQFGGQAKAHRLTLFKAVSGFRAYATARWRLWRQDGGAKERKARLDVIRRIRWRGRYLYVYARSSKSYNKRSCAAWRIYEHKEGSEGIAGKAWEADAVVTVRDLPKIDPESIPMGMTLEQTDERIRQYAESGNVNLEHMRAMQRVPRHLMGTVIEDSNGETWGVLLVDSTHDQCPFPKGGQKKFEKAFRTYAKMLSLLIS